MISTRRRAMKTCSDWGRNPTVEDFLEEERFIVRVRAMDYRKYQEKHRKGVFRLVNKSKDTKSDVMNTSKALGSLFQNSLRVVFQKRADLLVNIRVFVHLLFERRVFIG